MAHRSIHPYIFSLLLVAAFAIDLALPPTALLKIVGYLIPVGLTFWAWGRWTTAGVTVLAAGLFIAAVALHDGSVSLQLLIANRVVGASLILVAGWGTSALRGLVDRLSAREGMLQAIVDSEPACVHTIGAQGLILSMNPAGLSMLEADAPAQVIGRAAVDFVAQPHHAALIALVQRAFDGESGSLEYEVIGLKGTRRWLSMNAAPLHGEHGEVKSLLGVSQDITERRRNEAVLRESRQRLALALSSGSIATWDWDIRSGAVVFDARWAELRGLSPDDIAPRYEAWTGRLHPDEVAVASGALRDHFEGRSPAFDVELRSRSKSGEWLWVHCRGKVIERDGDASPVRMVVTETDITSRKRAEEQLRRTKEQLDQAGRLARLGYFEYDHRTNASYWSMRLRDILGVDEAVPASVGEYLKLVAAGDVDRVARAIAGVLDASGRHHTFDHRLVRPDGEVRHVSWTTHTEFSGEGAERKPVLSFGALIDISTRKAAEDERDDLARRLLDVQEEERRAVARDLHDEVGQALSALKLNLLNLQRLGGSPAPLLSDSLRIADEVLLQARDLALDLRPSVLDDLGLSAAVQWYTERMAGRARMEIDSLVEPDLPRLSPAREIMVFRVLQEALTNIHRHSHARRAQVSLQRRKDELELLIADDGIGFDIGAASALSRGGHMGLVSIRERAVFLGGQAEVTTAPGRGTAVHLSFPIEAAAPGRTAERISA